MKVKTTWGEEIQLDPVEPSKLTFPCLLYFKGAYDNYYLVMTNKYIGSNQVWISDVFDNPSGFSSRGTADVENLYNLYEESYALL